MYKSRYKIVSKFFEKLLKYRILFKDILTFLGPDFREALLMYSKNQIKRVIILHKNGS